MTRKIIVYAALLVAMILHVVCSCTGQWGWLYSYLAALSLLAAGDLANG